ncbi:MAG: DNA cytosine methyltransferase [Patescibacteria group bacterium]|nr:DNA cytosine methyltransferase [Patescibacteria group bacterium]
MTITVTDLFCGAGGSSTGLSSLPGVQVVMAANHWQLAIDSHQLNHPNTDHDSADISQVEPSRFPTTDILWASPECTNHSVAKGIKRQRNLQEQLPGLEDRLPDAAAIRSRATMWDVPRFAEFHQYRAIIIENVVDAYRWVQFPAWLLAMELLGYEHEIVWLNSMHAQARGLPAPQSRDRMYVVFWRKGNRRPDLQKWTRPRALCERHGEVQAVQVMKKKEAWGRYKAQYLYKCPQCAAVVEPGWLPAYTAIDFSIEGQRIGDREKPLSPKTMLRIEKGIERYWKPLVVAAAGNTYDGINTGSSYLRAYPTDTPLPIQQTTVQHALAFHPLITDGIHGEGTVQSGTEPMHTQTTAQTKGVLVVPVEGREGKFASLASEPMRTQSTRNETAIVVPLRNHGVAKSVSAPIDTVAAEGNHHALLMRNNDGGAEMTTPAVEPMRTLTTAGHQSLLVPYYGHGDASPASEPVGTLTTVDRYGIASPSLDVDDCMFRMLTPKEIKVGMAFPADYQLLGTKREQVKQSGNAVTPPAARDLGAAVIESLGIDVAMGWAA